MSLRAAAAEPKQAMSLCIVDGGRRRQMDTDGDGDAPRIGEPRGVSPRVEWHGDAMPPILAGTHIPRLRLAAPHLDQEILERVGQRLP